MKKNRKYVSLALGEVNMGGTVRWGAEMIGRNLGQEQSVAE